MGNAVVYRPAYDAEVEYLESTGTQWIDTGFRPDSTTTSFELDISFEGAFVYSGTSKTIIQQSVIEMDNQFCMNFGDGPHQGGDIFFWFGRNYDGLGGASLITNVALTRGIFRYSQGIVSYSGTSVDVNNSSFPPTIGRREGTMCILKDLECYNARLYGVKIWDNNVLVRDFIPVRIGTTGYMYDKVSRQLFANAGTGRFVLGNDVANATVPQLRHVVYFGGQRCVGFEKLYERKEWLVGDGEAYIDTDIIVDVPTLHYNLETVLTTASALCGSRNAHGENSSSVSVFTPTRLRLDIFDTATYADFSGGVIDVDVPNKVITINDVPFTTTRTNFGNADYSFRIFDLYYRGNYNDVPRGTMKIHHFSITDNSHNLSLIPCTLTMNLPASLDANNIARTKGTSGMWDLVSDKFYGNVASSGTFKAVNLAEGVDYEVHQWLVGDGAAFFYESINFQSAKWELSNVTKYAALNEFQFNAETYAAFQIVAYPYNRIGIGIFDNTGRGYLYTDVEDVNVIEIKSQTTSSSIVINETDFSNPTLTIKPYFNLSKVAFGDVKCSSITVDGIERYIPVKLLRSIPSKYDANGIARQAGECGMYDTVNDVFYGNVASSGSFTVSDDN